MKLRDIYGPGWWWFPLLAAGTILFGVVALIVAAIKIFGTR